MILAGDVGGTKVALALYRFEQEKLQHLRDEKYPAQEHAGLEEIVKLFLGDVKEKIFAACFGVPGPVRDGRLKLTNLPWELDSRLLARDLDIEHLFLINDLEANGYGIPELGAEQILTLHAGDASALGHRGLISAGTGLGEALLIWNGHKHVPVASEGGHGDYAARNELEIDLLQYLLREVKGRVSTERVVSGLGLHNIYKFLRDVKGLEETEALRLRMQNEDPNLVIGQMGEAGESELCVQTLDLFASAYGAEAGNVALKVIATGGIYLGGGIAPKILKTLQNGKFMQAFLDKGRLSGLLEQMPVRVILESRCALLGAAAYAEARAAEITGKSERLASA